MSKNTTVTTSWDDGHILDRKLADLLRTYRLPGTFYVAPEDHEFTPGNRLTPSAVREIAEDFEIGAHTITHPRLPQVDDKTAREEIAGSKDYLEDMTGKAITSFCYPGGEYQPQHIEMVKQAGYNYARTVDRFHYEVGPNPLLAPTSIHAYRHWSDAAPIARFAHFNPIAYAQYQLGWDDLAIAQFEYVRTRGGTFHIWGHSWEINRNGDWPRLERVFAHISDHKDIRYAQNRELV